MKVKVLLFAHIREIVGKDALSMEFDGKPTGNDLLEKLVQLHPEVENLITHLKLAMNGSYMESGDTIQENAEIAVFPPVSGG